jgi:hypothetical protein
MMTFEAVIVFFFWGRKFNQLVLTKCLSWPGFVLDAGQRAVN